MPRNTEINSVLIIGSGPIIIGQACEFDYSGTQAVKVLKEEGLRVVLVNSNPATIMTDPSFADKTYIEPLTAETLERIIDKERPDAVLPTLGGQTALNLALEVHEKGVLEKHNVKLLGASVSAIKTAESREDFKQLMNKCGLESPKSKMVGTLEEGLKAAQEIGFPLILRPSFTLGGTGSGIAQNQDEFKEKIIYGLRESPVTQVLVEESLLGYKEFELEVMRDMKDNVVIICSIENLDPMGVHTGDSITVAPAQTLTDKEYQILRDQSIKIIRAIGVETGGSNIQFAVNPKNGRVLVIEMNPRVSRSSALASKATGFPIAKMAALLSIGYTLDEIPNDINKVTRACFEPTIDYVVTKIPRFNMDKFQKAESTLNTQMKSVGEVMALGSSQCESLQKAISSLEGKVKFLGHGLETNLSNEEFESKIKNPTPERLHYIYLALKKGYSISSLFNICAVDPWFLNQMKKIADFENQLRTCSEENRAYLLKEAKVLGFSDFALGQFWNKSEVEIRELRKKLSILPVFKRVDSCAAEFESPTPYLYSTYGVECESEPTDKKKVIILGSGPNRIGQGIEFDYCCVHASFSLTQQGFESIMINCNPETVSTDYDTSDRLYFEPLNYERVMDIIDLEKPYGVILQFGGQTPLNLAASLAESGVHILGTDSSAIDTSEDRDLFLEFCSKFSIQVPPSGIGHNFKEVKEVVSKLDYPCILRPSYVLGGQSMAVVYDDDELGGYLDQLFNRLGECTVQIDRFLGDAIEFDVDVLADKETQIVCGVMQHIEEAGVHSGDSACCLPPYSIDPQKINLIKTQAKLIAKELKVIGLLNIQYALAGNGGIYLLEVNPRASRTVPFVSKAIGLSMVNVATKVMMGAKLKELGLGRDPFIGHFAVKEAVFPFMKFTETDSILGPEMKSTGEVMGISDSYEIAFAKAQEAAGNKIPLSGKAFISVRDEDKVKVIELCIELLNLGFSIAATDGTAQFLAENGIGSQVVKKMIDGGHTIGDHIKAGEICMVVNTTSDKKAIMDSYSLRRLTLEQKLPYFTTIQAFSMVVSFLKKNRQQDWELKSVKPLQEFDTYC